MSEDNRWIPTQKSKRCYHRVISGIERGGAFRFLTLTASNQSPDLAQHSFRVLYKRLHRRGLIRGYIKVPEMSKNGKQHVHVLFRGDYIDQRLISHWWQEIHHAKVVDIRRVGLRRSKRNIASYMAKYMSKDNWYRYSWNWDWVWKGFCGDWKKLKRLFRQVEGSIHAGNVAMLCKLWRMWLKGFWRPDFSLLLEPP